MTFSKTANRTHSPHSLRNNLREEKLHGAHIGNIILSFAGDTRYFRIVYTFCFIARDLGAFVNCLRHHFWRQSLPSLVTFSHGNPTKKDTSKINSLNIIIDQVDNCKHEEKSQILSTVRELMTAFKMEVTSP